MLQYQTDHILFFGFTSAAARTGNQESAEEESFGDPGLLEYPHYTRPAEWCGRDGVSRAVPEVLVSGDHARVRQWRRAEAERMKTGIPDRTKPPAIDSRTFLS